LTFSTTLPTLIAYTYRLGTLKLNIVESIDRVFKQRGDEIYAGEDVSQLQHATQCAKLAKQNNAPDYLVVAALLHDVGHIAGHHGLPQEIDENLDDAHEDAGFEFLKDAFSERILAPIRLHVAAKRYLCATRPEYLEALSPVSRKSLADQGGPMSEQECEAFRANPHFEDAVRLRQWDDQAKDPNEPQESIEDYLPLIKQVFEACMQENK